MEGTSTGTARGLTTQSLSTSPEGAVGIPAGSRYLLVVEQESARVHPLPAEGRILIGREAGEGGLALAATTASRRHAMLRVSAEEISVTDLSSHNGTCVNGRPIQHMTALRNGDVIAVAGALLVLKQQRPVAVASGASMTYLQCSVSSARVRMTAALESAAQYARPLSLIEFSLGEQAVLQDTAAALAAALPSTSMVIGLGGSARLIILLPDSEEADAVTQAQQLGKLLTDRGQEVAMGVVSYPRHGDDIDDLLRSVAAAAGAARKGEVHSASALVETIALGAQCIYACDPATHATLDLLRRLAPSSLSVLLTGETGTGKELAAQALHQWSARREQPLISVNCAALPRDLLEGELFGHERGAFSGAVAAKAGLIELAHRGTLFLDEIGELPLEMQAKLLRVLETKRVRRLGGQKDVVLDVRVVAATNRDLGAEIAAGRFRHDLYFRIQHATVRLLPLRERPRELAVLAQFFLDEACQRDGLSPKHLSTEALFCLRRYRWPGNLRQLKSAMELAALLSPSASPEILECHLPAEVCVSSGSPSIETPQHLAGSPAIRPLAEQIRELEMQQMLAAWRTAGYQKDAAAGLLGMPRSTYHLKWRKYALTNLARK